VTTLDDPAASRRIPDETASPATRSPWSRLRAKRGLRAGALLFAEARRRTRSTCFAADTPRSKCTSRTCQLVIETIGPGEVVGWSWLIEPYRWTFDARAQDSLGAIAIDGACLRAKSLDDPAFGYALLQRVAGQILARLQATAHAPSGPLR